MYLKEIEVNGFKSFANRMELLFHRGITCIVGPNGSGKSNIADAVRWVFGEQSSRELRSQSMQDVIFAGTMLRKPQSYAEVSVTLSNEDRYVDLDYDEIKVTRKVYRSGESEYRLNGKQVRLRDINELFYDTGIGKEGYSMIGQGQVNRILSGKTEERRELFDEATGIVKFKKRKTVSLKKLENERSNMLRISDVLSELERRVGPLKKASETAKEYLKLREQLKVYDVNAFLLDEKALQDSKQKIQANLQIANEHLKEQKAEEEALKKAYDEADEGVRILDGKAETIRSEIREAEALRSGIEREISLTEEKIRSEESARAHYLDRIREIEESIGAGGQKKENSLAVLQETSGLIKELEEKLSAEEKDVRRKSEEVSLYQKQTDDAHLEVVELLEQKADTNAELSRLQETISQADNRKKAIEDEQAALKTRVEENRKEQEELSASMAENESACAAKKLERDEAEKQYSEWNDAYHKTREKLLDLQRNAQILEGRIQSLRVIVEQYEGFNRAVKTVMNLKKTRKGILGTVSDVIRVEKKYRTLIETALGGNYQNVIVKTEDEAKTLIGILKEERAGRATFLPLDAIRASEGITDRSVFSEPGVIGTADTLVEADDMYQEAIRYLLGRFLAVDTVDHALAIARKHRHSVRIVTLEGEFLNVGGSISGGAFREKEGVLGRNEDLRASEKQAALYRKEIEKAERELQQTRQLRESFSVEADAFSEELHDLELEKSSLAAKSDAAKRQETRLRVEGDSLRIRMEETVREAEDAAIRKEAIETALRNLEETNAAKEGSQSDLKSLLEKSSQELQAFVEAREETRIRLASLREKKDFAEQSIRDLEAEAVRIQDEKAALNSQAALSDETIRTLRENLTSLKEQSLGQAPSDSALQNALDGLLNEKEKLSAKQRSAYEKQSENAEMLRDIEKEIVRLGAQAEKTEERLSALTDYLWNEYALTPTEAAAFRAEQAPDESPARIRRHCADLKNAIKDLGSVNVNAIEEYKEVGERFEFLKGQYEDLQKAEADLVKIVEDLDRGMKKQFSENFVLIQKEFDVVFKELFGGGTGSLELQDPSDPISSDILITSQPPGKRLQNMMQLSGGENALTAIALLFAIQRLKPSPFCLLDEIEAALDETNVVRFANYLKQLTDRTQYVVITHRRGTMNAADTLYGITMQEKGISALVSVNLIEKDLE